MPQPGDVEAVPLDYADLSIGGLNRMSYIISSERQSDGGISWDADPLEEFHIDKNDPRYQFCAALAQELKRCPLYPNPQTQEQIVANEEHVVRTLHRAIHEQFGGYNEEVSTALENDRFTQREASLHGDVLRKKTGNPANLNEFRYGELICRHYAPLMADLCQQADVPTFYVGGYMNQFYLSSAPFGEQQMQESKSNEKQLMHAFLVSRRTGHVIEATTSRDTNPYLRTMNGVSVEDFLAGQTIVAAEDQANFKTYGTGLESGSAELVENRRVQLARANLTDLQGSILPQVVPFGKNWAEAQKDYFASLAAHDFALVKTQYSEKIAPLVERFSQGAREGNVTVVKECLSALSFSELALINRAQDAVRRLDVPMASLLISTARAQGYTQWQSTQDALVEVPDWLAHDEPAKLAQMQELLQLSPLDYAKSSLTHRKPEHFARALAQLEAGPHTPQNAPALMTLGQTLRELRWSAEEERFSAFMQRHYPLAELVKNSRENTVPLVLHPEALAQMESRLNLYFTKSDEAGSAASIPALLRTTRSAEK